MNQQLIRVWFPGFFWPKRYHLKPKLNTWRTFPERITSEENKLLNSLTMQGLPNHIFQLGDIFLGKAGNENRRNIGWQRFPHLGFQFFVY